MKKIAVILVSLLVAACASTQKADTPPVAQAIEKSAPAVASPVASTVSDAEVTAGKLKAEIEALQKRSVYFDFDKYVVKSEFQAVVKEQAEFLKGHTTDVVTLQGNCDDRGSAEYNLALGNERAQAVEKNLEIMGVAASQIKVISFGEEKPRLTCHEEKCWKENRRVDFVHDLK